MGLMELKIELKKIKEITYLREKKQQKRYRLSYLEIPK